MDEKEQINPFITDKFARISRAAMDLLGYPDRMLYPSKSMGKQTTIFNANVYNSRAEKIWYGDLEIERDREALLELSNRLGPLYILYEMDGRFLRRPPTPARIQSVAPVAIRAGEIIYSREYQKGVEALTERQQRKTQEKAQKERRK